MNRLYFGDNLKWLSDRKEFPDTSVDLVYLDPPFNSNADYNVLFREPSGQVSQAQFHAFTDTWSWADAADTYHQFIDNCPNVAVVELMAALHSFLKHSPMMAYLAMMAPRLVELHRILKPTGSLYLHCDPTADHYLRMLLDGIFGAVNFRDEIIWKRRGIARLCEGAKFSLRKTHQFVIRASIAVIAASRTTGDGVEITLLVFVREYDPQLYEAFVTKKITAWALLMKLRELDPEFGYPNYLGGVPFITFLAAVGNDDTPKPFIDLLEEDYRSNNVQHAIGSLRNNIQGSWKRYLAQLVPFVDFCATFAAD